MVVPFLHQLPAQIERVLEIVHLVPADHLIRNIEAVIDFNFIYPLIKDMYSTGNGWPSIDPIVLIKMVLVQCLFGIHSIRRTAQNKYVYAKRKETIERVFADTKEKHGIQWTTLRIMGILSIKTMPAFAIMNLKKLAC